MPKVTGTQPWHAPQEETGSAGCLPGREGVRREEGEQREKRQVKEIFGGRWRKPVGRWHLVPRAHRFLARMVNI